MSKRKKSFDKHAPQVRSEASVSSALSLGVPAGVAIIALVAVLAYLPSLNDGFVLDDDLTLAGNKLINASDGLYRFWFTTESQDYWPVTYTALWIEWRLWGMHPTDYHITNLILHIVESLLIWLILRKMSTPGAFLAALLFAVHPVNVESVAWIASRKNLTAMLFFLLSILWYLKYQCSRHTPCAVPTHGERGLHKSAVPAHGVCGLHYALWYWLSLAAFVLAMLSKGSVAVLPVMLLGIAWWLREKKGTVPLYQRGTVPFFSDLVRTAPFFAVGIALAGVNVWFQAHGTGEVARTAGFTERLLGAGGVVWFYLYKAILPFDLTLVYRQWNIQVVNPLWWLPLFAALAVTGVLWLYRKSWSRPLLFAWGFFCVALVPVMGFSDVGFMKHSLVADRYLHIAIIGVIGLASAGFNAWHQQSRGTTFRKVTVVSVTVVGLLTFLTWRQSGLYQDAVTLYRAALEKNPDSWLAHNNLGLALDNLGQPKEAIEHYRQALRLYPNLPEAHNNLGNLMLREGRLQEAIDHYQKALRQKPSHFAALNNLGAALVKTGRPKEAIELYEKALRSMPTSTEVYNNLGNLMFDSGRLQDAIENFQHAIRLRPENYDAHYNLGNALVRVERRQEAIEQYIQALRIKPNNPDAHNNLGIVLADEGRLPEAIEQYQQAIRLKPDYEAAYINLMTAYANTGRADEAIATAQRALELARSQGLAADVKQIEDWLNSYRAGLSK